MMILPSTSGMHPGGASFYRAQTSFPPSSSSATLVSSSSTGDLKKEPSPHPLDPRLQRRRVTLSSRQPPAKCFPREILRAIFRFARRTQSLYDVKFPLRVSHVSRTWRKVALDDPTLWSSLVIKPYHTAEFITSYMPRSQGCPIHIRFAYRGKDWPMHFLEIIEVLARHTQRWRELQIELQDVRLLRPVLGSFETLSAPNLEGFSLSLEHEGRDPQSYGIPMFLGGAPKLIQVYFSNVDPSRVYLGKAPVQLLQVSTDNHALVRHNALKSMCEARETLTTLVLHRLDLFEHTGQFMVFLPNLEQLLVDGVCTSHFDIMKYLGAPNLRRLVILGGKNSSVFEEWLTKEVKTNRVNLFQSVETLEFWGMSEYVYLSMNHMMLFPSVAHIKVLQGEFRPLLRRLRDSVWRKVRIWPRLRVLTLEHASDPATERPSPGSLSCLRNDEEDQFEIICNVVSARKHIESPLRKLRLSSDLLNELRNRPQWLEYLERNQVELLDAGYSTVEFAKSKRFEENGGF